MGDTGTGEGRLVRKTIVLAVASTALFALAFEGTVRLLRPDIALPQDPRRFRFGPDSEVARAHHVRDRRLGWRLKPGQLMRVRVADRPAPAVMRTNSHGFRGEEFALEKPPNVYRILLAGDSNPMGFGLPDDREPYPARAESLLTRYFSRTVPFRFEAINMGVDGYSSHQTGLVLDEYLGRIGADVVGIQVGFNDHTLAATGDRDHRFARPWPLDLLERSHAYRWLRRRILLVVGPRRSDAPPVPRVSLDDYEANLREMVRGVKRAGALCLLLTTPACPSIPLVVNEVPVQADGATRWMTQESWILERLRAAGVDPPRSPDDPRYLPVVRRAADEHPDWALPRYLMAEALERQGRSEEAAKAHEGWRARDGERDVLDGYMDRLGRVAREEGAVVVDVGQVLSRAAAELGRGAEKGFYLDFVHLTARGHAVVATEVARIIAGHILAERTRPGA
jgi:lysophospholipase L1-like esterase